MLSAQITDSIHWLTDASRRFGVNHRQDGWLVLDERSFQLIKGEPFTPGLFNSFKFVKFSKPKYNIKPLKAVPLPARKIIIEDLILIYLSLNIANINTNNDPT